MALFLELHRNKEIAAFIKLSTAKELTQTDAGVSILNYACMRACNDHQGLTEETQTMLRDLIAKLPPESIEISDDIDEDVRDYVIKQLLTRILTTRSEMESFFTMVPKNTLLAVIDAASESDLTQPNELGLDAFYYACLRACEDGLNDDNKAILTALVKKLPENSLHISEDLMITSSDKEVANFIQQLIQQIK